MAETTTRETQQDEVTAKPNDFHQEYDAFGVGCGLAILIWLASVFLMLFLGWWSYLLSPVGFVVALLYLRSPRGDERARRGILMGFVVWILGILLYAASYLDMVHEMSKR